MSFARVTLAGTLLQDPEKRFTQNNNAVSILQLAVPMPPRRNQTEAQQMVVKVVCWRNMAEAVTGLQRGSILHVEGRLQMNTVTTPEGIQKKMFEVDAQQIHQLASLPVAIRPESNGQGAMPTMTGAPVQASIPASQVPGPAPAPMAGVAAPAQANPGAQNFSDLSADDFLTEDDIPF